MQETSIGIQGLLPENEGARREKTKKKGYSSKVKSDINHRKVTGDKYGYSLRGQLFK
jgi:hypothetical protein